MSPMTKGQRTEAAFHEAARVVFAERGYLNAKVADIAERAGRSSGSFYNYYDNKQKLLEAMLEKFTDRVLDRTRAGLTRDPAANIEQAVRAYVDTYRDYLPEMMAAFQMSTIDEQFAQWWRGHRADGVAAVLTVVQSVEKRGHAVDLDAGVFASAIVSMLESFCWTWFVSGGDEHVENHDDEVAIRTLTEIWRRALHVS